MNNYWKIWQHLGTFGTHFLLLLGPTFCPIDFMGAPHYQKAWPLLGPQDVLPHSHPKFPTLSQHYTSKG